MSLNLAAIAAAQADPPGNVSIDLDFTTINWWLFAVLFFLFLLGLRVFGKQNWAGTAAAAMFVFALVYALFMKYALPPLLNL